MAVCYPPRVLSLSLAMKIPPKDLKK